MSAKIHVEIEINEELHAVGAPAIKAGEAVEIKPVEGQGLQVVTRSGVVLGAVPAANVQQLDSSYSGHVRTIKKVPATGEIAGIAVRLSRDAEPRQAAGSAAISRQNEEGEDSFKRLTTEQLTRLANDEGIGRFLRDKRLQKVVSDVDRAADREAALRQMLTSPNFKDFTDKVLAVASPDAAG